MKNLYVALAVFVTAVGSAYAVGPASVVRPLDGDLPLAPMPPTAGEVQVTSVTALGPAAEVSQVEALDALPTDAELQAAAEAEAEAKRPPPLAPKRIPQRVQELGGGRFLIVPQEAPLQTNGTLNGMMFKDETETLAPEATAVGTGEAEPTMADDFQTVRDELQAINADLTSITQRLTSETAAVVSPTAAVTPTLPVPPKQVVVLAPPKPLTLLYANDSTTPTNGGKLKAWAAGVAHGGSLKLQVITRTSAPPLGSTLEDIAQTRWNVVREMLVKQGVKLGRVSFIHMQDEKQALVMKVVK